MVDYSNVDYSGLRTAIKELNGSGLLEVPIKMIGTNKQDLADAFVKNVERLAEEGFTDDLPDVVYNFFNDVAEVVKAGGEDPKTDDDTKAVPKKKTAKKKTAKAAEPVKEDAKEEEDPLPEGYAEARKMLIKAGVKAGKIDSIEFIHKIVREDPKVSQKEMIKQLTARNMMTDIDFVNATMEVASA